MKVPLLDLRAQHQAIRGEVMAAVERVFESQQFVLGAEVEEFERAAAAYCGSRHAMGAPPAPTPCCSPSWPSASAPATK